MKKTLCAVLAVVVGCSLSPSAFALKKRNKEVDAKVRKGLDYLNQHIPRSQAISRESHFLYGQYYAVQAMWHAGGKHWQRWYPAIHDALLMQQQQNGSWENEISPEYETAMACLILQMPNSYLPIFQR